MHATNKDYFAILGVAMDADRAEIQKAYFELARQVHPDRLRKQKIEDLVDKSTEVFKVLSDAYNLLINPQMKAAYIEKMGEHVAATGKVMGAESDRVEMAKIFHHKFGQIAGAPGFITYLTIFMVQQLWKHIVRADI